MSKIYNLSETKKVTRIGKYHDTRLNGVLVNKFEFRMLVNNNCWLLTRTTYAKNLKEALEEY